jgi:transcription antitermination protein NusB
MEYDLEPDDKNAPLRSARRRSREFALQGVYQYLMNRSDYAFILTMLEQAPEFKKSDIQYLKRLLSGILDNPELLLSHVTPYIDREVHTISLIEHAVLLIGAYEILHCLDIPYKVVINEAIELTKRFGGIEGYKYINGVLDRLANQVR